MSDELLRIMLQVRDAQEASAQELESRTIELRRELLELDVEAVEPASRGEPPPGARAIDVAQVGMLVVTIANSASAILGLITAVHAWQQRNRRHDIRLTLNGQALEITGLSSTEQYRLAQAWLDRAARKPRK